MDFRILGPLEVAANGAPVALAGEKQRGLLAVLLLNAGEVVSNERLIDALWGEQPPETARKAVQVHVSQLRKVLGADVIVTRPHGYVLELAEPDQLDLNRFRRLCDDARSAPDPARAAELLDEALGLWRGPPLADLASEAFARAEIAQLEELRIAAHEDRVAAQIDRGHHAEAARELERLVAAHPLRERLRAQLMLALYRSGRQADALDAYRAARATLTEQLGIEPGRELRELQERILNQDPALDLPPAPDRVRRPAPEGLVGRDRERAELSAALDDALAGRGRLVLLAGEPGIGKSSLAGALIGEARARGARILVGRCWEAGGAPAYWPWVQALRGYLRDTPEGTIRAQLGGRGAELATVLPEIRNVLPDLPAVQEPESEGARFRVLESVASFLAAAAATAPLVVFLDDLHAADASSLLLLRLAAAQLVASPALVVGCYRDTEVGSDLAEALADLSREPAARVFALKGLDASATRGVLRLALGVEPDEELAVRVHAETQGNPLFAGEVGRLLASQEEPLDGKLPVPAGVTQAIAQRLGRQSPACRDVLAVGSVVGREFAPAVVGRVCGLGEDDLLAATDEARAARLLDAAPTGDRLSFAHILVRDALYEALASPRRLRLHQAVAEVLESLYATDLDPHLAELAHHYVEGGSATAGRAVEYSRRAGDRAMAQYGYEEAARQYAAGLRVLEAGADQDEALTCELLLSRGEALSRAGDADGARRVLLRSAALAERTGRADQLARAAVAVAGRFGWARASSDPELVPLLERALAAVGRRDPPTRVRLLARLAAALRDEPSRARRQTLSEEAMATAEELRDPQTLAFALEGWQVAVEGPDSSGGWLDHCDRLIALGRETGDRERVYSGYDHRLHNLWQLADRAGVDATLETLDALAGDLRQPAQLWHVHSSRTMTALMEGRFGEAELLAAETRALGQRAQSWNAEVTHRLATFVLRREQGRLVEMEDTIRRSVHEYPALLRFRCAHAHLLAAVGRDADAAALLGDLLALDLRHVYVDAEWLFSMALLCDPCARVAGPAAIEKLYEVVLPYERLYAQAPVETVFGSMARGLGVLATALARFDEAERHFEVAIDNERRMRARPWLAHAQHDLASMLLARNADGDAERAALLLDDAAATYRALGMEAWAERASAVRAH